MDRLKSKSPDVTVLQLYIAGDTLKSRLAIANLTDICQKQLKGKFKIEVIDLAQHPKLAIDKNISALPTLIKELPLPVRTLIGDLVSKEQVLVALDIKSVQAKTNLKGKPKGRDELRIENERLSTEIARLKAENDNLRLMFRKNDR